MIPTRRRAPQPAYPRFVFRSLRSRLTVLYAGFVTAGLVVLTIFSQITIERSAHRSAAAELAASSSVYDKLWEERERSLIGAADVVARDFGFRSAVATGDVATIGSALDSLRARVSVSHAVLVDAGGRVIGDAGPLRADIASLPARLRSQRRDAVVAIGTRAFRVVTAPVLAPIEIGRIAFIVPLDAAEMRGLEGLSAIPLDAAVLTKAPDGRWTGAGVQVPATMTSGTVATLATKAGNSFAMLKPLRGADGTPEAALLLAYPMQRALAPYRSLQLGLVLAGLVWLGLIVYGSGRLAEGIAGPIAALDRAARRLADGERTEVAVTTEDEVERRVGERDARGPDLALDRFVVVEAKPEQERAQRHALQDERAERDREGGEQQQVAFRKGRRQRQRGGDGDEPAHPAPADDEAALPRRVAAALLGPAGGRQAAREADVERQHPGKPHDDDDRDDRGAEPRPARQLPRCGIGDGAAELDTDQAERQRVEQHGGGVPHRVGRHPQPRRRGVGGGAGGGHREGDDGQDRRQADRLRQHPDAECAGELQDDRPRRVVDQPDDPRPDECEDRPGDERADHRNQEGGRDRLDPDAAPRHRRADRQPVDQERGGVVEERFTSQDHAQPVRQPDRAQDGVRRRRVGRRDDGAQRDRRRPGQVRHQPARDQRDRGGGEDDRDDDEPHHRLPVGLQVADRGVVGGVEQDGRDEQRQREVGVEFERYAHRQQRQPRAGDRQQRGIGHADPCGQPQQRDRADEDEEDRLERGHRCSLECFLTGTGAAAHGSAVMDITQLILDEHAEQRKLFAQIDDIDRSDKAALAAIWGRLKALLDSHAEAEERFFYPRLMEIGTGGGDAPSKEEETEDAIEDHNEIRDTGEAVGAHPVGSAEWFGAVNACNKANSDHLAEEERQGLTDFRRHATIEERHALGVRFAQFEAEHRMGVTPVDKDPKQWVKDHELG